jgi:hypothetical protein
MGLIESGSGAGASGVTAQPWPHYIGSDPQVVMARERLFNAGLRLQSYGSLLQQRDPTGYVDAKKEFAAAHAEADPVAQVAAKKAFTGWEQALG